MQSLFQLLLPGVGGFQVGWLTNSGIQGLGLPKLELPLNPKLLELAAPKATKAAVLHKPPSLDLVAQALYDLRVKGLRGLRFRISEFCRVWG